MSADALRKDTKAVLRMAGSQHYHQVDLKDWVSTSEPPTVHGDPQYIIVMSPMFGSLITPQVAIQLLRHHMTWHLTMGFTSYLVYCRRHLLTAYQEEAWLAAAIKSGKLRLVFWDEWVIQGDYADQGIVFNHAMLTHWTNPQAYLLPLDADEYFATDKPTSFATVMKQCLHNYSLVRFPRWDAISAIKDQLSLWSEANWLMHPLENYCVLHGQAHDRQPKYIAQASDVYSCSIHDCALKQGLYLESHEVESLECNFYPFLMHIHSLLSPRLNTSLAWQDVTCYEPWHWVLPHMHA